MTTKEEVLKACKVEGVVVKLPEGQLDRKLYQDVAKSLELIGGKWKGGKVFGFVFNEDPTELLEEIATGQKRNLKKEFQFFATPDDLADYLVGLAETMGVHKILEPSAGQGAIVKAIVRDFPEAEVDCYELMPTNQIILKKVVGVNLKGDNFFACNGSYDRIIANPPFSKNQDIDHIMHMYQCLNKGGRIVTIASKHWQFCDNKKELAFKNWLSQIGAEVIEIESGKFKESGTMVSTCIIVINK
jgi:hypothetical protein